MTMKQRIMQNRRILLQVAVEGALQGAELSPDPIFSPTNGSSETNNTKRNHRQQQQQQQQQQQHSTSPFDSSMALTILVLLTALFFMGFFSIYIRRFSDEDSPDVRRRRNPSRPARASSVLHDNHKVGGVDSSTIKALPLVSYCGVAKQLITDCPICLSEFEEREIVKLIPHCRHVFHAECLDTWLASHVSCPLCRETQFFKVAVADGDDDDDQEVRLDVAEEQDSNGVSEFGRRSTVADCDTWRGVGMRRSCSCRSLGNRLVLQRSMSF